MPNTSPAEVSNYGAAGTSFKKSMEHLQKTLRNIADSHLHQNIRRKKSLPTETQVDFRIALDQLLSKVIRTARCPLCVRTRDFG